MRFAVIVLVVLAMVALSAGANRLDEQAEQANKVEAYLNVDGQGHANEGEREVRQFGYGGYGRGGFGRGYGGYRGGYGGYRGGYGHHHHHRGGYYG